MTKPTTLAILIMTVALMTVGIAGSQLAAATTSTLTNSQFGQADRSSVARTVTFTTEFTPEELITDVNIRVDFEKEGDNNCFRGDTRSSFSREMGMSLRSPSGTLVKLVLDLREAGSPTYTSNGNANRVQVTFDDEAATFVGGSLPVSGTFKPPQALSAFDGQSPLGTWTFVFIDRFSDDFLCFFRYDLTIIALSPIVPVDIDIKPGSFPSSVDCNENQPVPVAVFSTPTFDATTIVPASLELNGVATPEIHDKVHIEDVKRDGVKDGILDAVLHLDRAQVCASQKPNPMKESVDAILTGSLTDGTPFEGEGDIRPMNVP